MTTSMTEAEASEFEKSFRVLGDAAHPWGWLDREVAVAERTIRALNEGAPGSDSPDVYTPHVGAGWYSQEILARAKWIENAKDSGNWELVARFSHEIGQLSAIIQLKNIADEDFEAGRAIKKTREDAIAATRLWSRDERIAAIQTILDDSKGKLGVTAAIKAAAKQNPGRGGWKAFEADWYAKKVP